MEGRYFLFATRQSIPTTKTGPRLFHAVHESIWHMSSCNFLPFKEWMELLGPCTLSVWKLYLMVSMEGDIACMLDEEELNFLHDCKLNLFKETK